MWCPFHYLGLSSQWPGRPVVGLLLEVCRFAVAVIHLLSRVWLSKLQAARLPRLSRSPRAGSDFCPLSWWCRLTSSSFASCFYSCLQSFPASGSFPVSQLFTSGGQRIGVSVSASVLPVNIQDWFLLGLTGLTSLQSKGLSRLFSTHSSKASTRWHILACNFGQMTFLSKPQWILLYCEDSLIHLTNIYQMPAVCRALFLGPTERMNVKHLELWK